METTKTKHRSDSSTTTEISHEHSEYEAFMIDEIQQAVREANSGDFVSPDEVKAVVSKWVTNIC